MTHRHLCHCHVINAMYLSSPPHLHRPPLVVMLSWIQCFLHYPLPPPLLPPLLPGTAHHLASPRALL
ncbi:unnamed protein product [Closterium sp. NIES-54]